MKNQTRLNFAQNLKINQNTLWKKVKRKFMFFYLKYLFLKRIFDIFHINFKQNFYTDRKKMIKAVLEEIIKTYFKELPVFPGLKKSIFTICSKFCIEVNFFRICGVKVCSCDVKHSQREYENFLKNLVRMTKFGFLRCGKSWLQIKNYYIIERGYFRSFVVGRYKKFVKIQNRYCPKWPLKLSFQREYLISCLNLSISVLESTLKNKVFTGIGNVHIS